MELTREWIRQEAARQGLPLTDGDVEAIYERVTTIKRALAAARPDDVDGLESPYRFVVGEREPGSATTLR